MRRSFNPALKLRIPFGRMVITLGAGWLVIIPAGIWGVATIILPIIGPSLNRTEGWVVTVIIVGLSGGSLIAHALAHGWLARLSGSDLPSEIPVYPFGDAAQVWPAASSPWREALAALAGPLINVLFGGLAYWLWDVQLHPYLNISMIFLACFNVGVAVISLTPAFPLDGGRLVRAIGWGLLGRPASATRLGIRLGLLIAAGFAGWGFFLIAQQVHFSLQTGTVALVFAGLILLPLRGQPAWKWDRPEPARRLGLASLFIRALIAGLLILSLLSITLSLVPLNNGLELPGFAIPIEPMIDVPPQHRYPVTGSFLLTTVVPQTPITAGEWVLGQLSPVVKIVPPEQLVPPGTTAQTVARQQYQMLEESETIAIAVGLRLAGYDAETQGQGARIISILPGSPAKDILQPGDVITGLNGEVIKTTTELINLIRKQQPQAVVPLQIEREGQKLDKTVALMPAAEPDGSPRLGVSIESAGFRVKLPFPVRIVPQKIVGGPSAGLMFSLTVYNLVTPGDLTNGRKIAGTGTINPAGTVGPIGGVQQKVAGAEIAGAEYFLSPPQNYEDARAVAGQIKVIKVATAAQAIQFLRSLSPVAGQ